VRRFFCATANCPALTSTEQVDGLTTRYAAQPAAAPDAREHRTGCG
jgi:hypothetical protein